MKILVLGVDGMLGHTLARYLSAKDGLEVTGTSRSNNSTNYLNTNSNLDLIYGLDVSTFSLLENIIKNIMPDVIINCVGIIKQNIQNNNQLNVILINSVLPHQLNLFCEKFNLRLIHISTDCVFSGRKGNYSEFDFCDGDDLYARSKFLGELSSSKNTITLRTSIIGHELFSTSGLLEWFLSQSGDVQGFTKAIFSGLTTLEISKVIFRYVISDPNLTGLYHLSSHSIDKYSLLKIISNIYGRRIKLYENDQLVIDRSLDSSKFRNATKWSPPSWAQMIEEMHNDFILSKNFEDGLM